MRRGLCGGVVRRSEGLCGGLCGEAGLAYNALEQHYGAVLEHYSAPEQHYSAVLEHSTALEQHYSAVLEH